MAEFPRAVACLTVATAGVLLAFTHTSKTALDRLDMVPGVRRLGQHLSTTGGRATVDASGLAEGLGMALATTLYVGAVPLHGLPGSVRTAGAVLAISYVWDAVLQAVIDPGWYNEGQPPSAGMRVFRPLIPVILCGLVAVFVWPWSDVGHEVPSAVLGLLIASPLLYYPVWGAFDVVLRASAGQVTDAVEESRRTISTDIHGLIKNPLMLLHQHLHEGQAELAEVRRLSWTTVLHVEDFRQELLSAESPSQGIARTFEELWESFSPIVPSVERVKLVVTSDSLAVVLSPTDYQLAQLVLPDLVMNALRSGAGRVEVTCRRAVRDAVREIQVEVLDNGPGVGAGWDPGSSGSGDLPGGPAGSLRALEARLRRFGGTIRLTDRSDSGDAGTRAFAYWRDQGRTADALTAAGSGSREG